MEINKIDNLVELRDLAISNGMDINGKLIKYLNNEIKTNLKMETTLKASELRIGNFVKEEKRQDTYLCILSLGIGGEGRSGICVSQFPDTGESWKNAELSFIGIPLTEEWLVRLGFDKYSQLRREEFMLDYFDGKIIINAYSSDDNEGAISTNIKHVHQLQNLYFALTGEELTIKQ